jgi:hypothetical protein
MLPDILQKLEKELRRKITSERQVVYILVQIRKVVDKEYKENFETLKLHCDWAVHTELTRTSARALLGKLNQWYSALAGWTSPNEASQKLAEKLGLESFRADFRRFLEHHGLPGSFCDGDSWFDFLYHYVRVIQDCPLVCKAKTQHDWKFDEVVLVGDPDDTWSADRVAIQWELLKDGRVFSLSLVQFERPSLERKPPRRSSPHLDTGS